MPTPQDYSIFRRQWESTGEATANGRSIAIARDESSMAFISAAIVIGRRESRMVNAHWDTGAEISCVSRRLIRSIQPKPQGCSVVAGVSGETTSFDFVVDIMLAPEFHIRNVEVCSALLARDDIDLIIGMDIISMGDLAISNYDGRPTLSFRIPSLERTDYTQQ